MRVAVAFRPIMMNTTNLQGVEAVIDKDLCSALLAENLDADLFISQLTFLQLS